MRRQPLFPPASAFRLFFASLSNRVTSKRYSDSRDAWKFCPKHGIPGLWEKLTQRILNRHAENSQTYWYSFRDRPSREPIGARADLKLEH
jgi:hypothetical protein